MVRCTLPHLKCLFCLSENLVQKLQDGMTQCGQDFVLQACCDFPLAVSICEHDAQHVTGVQS